MATKTCPICQQTFEGRSDKKHCSDSCRSKAYQKQLKEIQLNEKQLNGTDEINIKPDEKTLQGKKNNDLLSRLKNITKINDDGTKDEPEENSTPNPDEETKVSDIDKDLVQPELTGEADKTKQPEDLPITKKNGVHNHIPKLNIATPRFLGIDAERFMEMENDFDFTKWDAAKDVFKPEKENEKEKEQSIAVKNTFTLQNKNTLDTAQPENETAANKKDNYEYKQVESSGYKRMEAREQELVKQRVVLEQYISKLKADMDSGFFTKCISTIAGGIGGYYIVDHFLDKEPQKNNSKKQNEKHLPKEQSSSPDYWQLLCKGIGITTGAFAGNQAGNYLVFKNKEALEKHINEKSHKLKLVNWELNWVIKMKLTTPKYETIQVKKENAFKPEKYFKDSGKNKPEENNNTPENNSKEDEKNGNNNSKEVSGMDNNKPEIDEKEDNLIRDRPKREAKFKSPNVKKTQDVLNKIKNTALNFDGDWVRLLGKPAYNFPCVIYGSPGSGKSHFALQFGKYLAERFGIVVYVSAEEGFNLTFQEKLRHTEAAVEDFYALDVKNLQGILDNLEPDEANFIIIDSVNYMDIDEVGLRQLKARYPHSAIIAISQSTKGGDIRGSNEIPHEVDTVIRVVEGFAEATKGRYNGEKGFLFDVFKIYNNKGD